MAQGAIKKTAKPNSVKAGKGGHQKKGTGSAAAVKKRQPQRSNKTAADKMQKKFAAGLVAKTEKLLAERAGHLELIAKVKKSDKAGADAKKQRGGTRKFG